MIKKTVLFIGILSLSFVVWMNQSIGQTRYANEENNLAEGGNSLGSASPSNEQNNGSSSELLEQDQRMQKVAEQLASACTQVLSKWISSKEVSEDMLFSYLYYPVEDTNPTKFHTDYDQFSDRDLQDILERHLTMQPDTIYAVLTDKNGYIPTHNRKYSQPLTGDVEKDLLGNRTKRIYADKTGLAASRNTDSYLLQTYKRDTGQTMVDLSIPIVISGRHWGAVRVGYLRTE